MIPRAGLSHVLIGLALLGVGGVCHARDFDFQVSGFGVDGNLYGPAAVADLNVPISCCWGRVDGTVFTQDGVLHLTSPGTLVPDGFGALPGTTLDISMAQAMHPVLQQAGPFTARAFWVPIPLQVGDFIHFSLVSDALDVFGIAISNATPVDLPTRYDVSQLTVRLGGGAPTLQQDTVSLDPAEITGGIVFGLSYDGDSLQTAFSVDGGATFRTPFPKKGQFIFIAPSAEASFLLGADPLASAADGVRTFCPATASVTGRHALKLRAQGSGTQVVQGTLRVAVPAGYDPIRAGLQLAVRDPGAPQAALVSLTGPSAVPAGVPGGGCDPRDGWTRRGDVYRYRNVSDALPPLCTPGSANGLTMLRLPRRRGRMALRIRATTPLQAGPLTASVVFGSGDPALSGVCVSANASCASRRRGIRCR